jgi:hypothetical protein
MEEPVEVPKHIEEDTTTSVLPDDADQMGHHYRD